MKFQNLDFLIIRRQKHCKVEKKIPIILVYMKISKIKVSYKIVVKFLIAFLLLSAEYLVKLFLTFILFIWMCLVKNLKLIALEKMLYHLLN